MDDSKYNPFLAFGFSDIGNEISNEVIFDWLDVIIFWYIAIIFSITGSRLEYTTAFIFNLRIFGILELWTQLREEPVYISSSTANALIRCFGASLITTTVQKKFDGDSAVEGWTIISVTATSIVVLIDPYLREAAGCSKELGPPTADFPYGSWEDCEEWQLAYYATWYYAFAPFLLLAFGVCFFCICARCCGIYDTICRFRTHIAIALIAGNAAALATRAYVRRLNTDSHIDHVNNFLEICFYVYVIIIFVAMEMCHRCLENHACLKCCCRITVCACTCLALPLVLLDTLLKKIGEKLSKEQVDDDDL